VADLVPGSEIEAIVGARRDERQHLGRAVSAEETVYILHSEQCRQLHDAGTRDMRECLFSLALDRGIDPADWAGMEDRPVVLRARGGRLTPATALPQRLQLRRTKGWRKPGGAVVVARPGRWGNPWVVHQHGERCGEDLLRCPVHSADSPADAVRLYRHAVLWPVTGQPEVPTPDEIRDELAGHDLACWCPPGQPCHADFLLELANGGEPRG